MWELGCDEGHSISRGCGFLGLRALGRSAGLGLAWGLWLKVRKSL